jgi:hypothetical protein
MLRQAAMALRASNYFFLSVLRRLLESSANTKIKLSNAWIKFRYKVIFIGRHAVGALHFYPAKPPLSGSVIYKICRELGLSMEHGINPDGPTIFWPTSEYPSLEPLSDLINGHCIDINKTTVMRLFADAFGYNYGIDPRFYCGPYVRKSNLNAKHDGVECHAPSEPDPRYVYQRLINNSTAEGLVEDLRVIYIDGLLDFAYRKVRPITDRFSNTNSAVYIVRTSDVISAKEQEQIGSLCKTMGLQYGEIDTLRDRDDLRLYVVDVNRQPYGPPNGLPAKLAWRAVTDMAANFRRAFLLEVGPTKELLGGVADSKKPD